MLQKVRLEKKALFNQVTVILQPTLAFGGTSSQLSGPQFPKQQGGSIRLTFFVVLLKLKPALASVAQLVGSHPAKQKVTSSVTLRA